MKNKEIDNHMMEVFRAQYMTPTFYGEEELKEEQLQRAKKIMLDKCGLRGGSLEQLATLSEFTLSGE